MRFWKRERPELDPTSLGNLLVQAGLCSEAQLREAVLVKRGKEDQLLGETMVSMGVLSPLLLQAILEQQSALRARGASRAKKYAHTAARTTLALSGSLEALNSVALEALHKLKP